MDKSGSRGLPKGETYKCGLIRMHYWHYNDVLLLWEPWCAIWINCRCLFFWLIILGYLWSPWHLVGQHFNLFERYPDQLVVSNEMGSLEEVVTVSLAEMEEGELLDHEDHQNLILTNRRFRMVINKVGIKVFIKYCFFLFSEEQIEKILDKASKKWLVKERRLGQRKS